MAQRFKYVLSRKIQNDLISKHNGYKGGDLDVPIIPNTVTQQSTEQPAPATPPPTPATPIVQASTLPETAQDWKNMTDDELLKITPDDIINNLSEASFRIAFRQNIVQHHTRNFSRVLQHQVQPSNCTLPCR